MDRRLPQFSRKTSSQRNHLLDLNYWDSPAGALTSPGIGNSMRFVAGVGSLAPSFISFRRLKRRKQKHRGARGALSLGQSSRNKESRFPVGDRAAGPASNVNICTITPGMDG